MLLSLIINITITIICLWSGFIFYRYILKNEETKPVIFYAISGLILLTIISQVAALFLPVNIYLLAVILLLLFLFAFFKKNQFATFFRFVLNEIVSLPLYAKALLIVLWLMIILINSGPVMMDDTESYHIQMIKWIQEYGSVPGIVNLHERYGFNSSWFSSIAFFGSIAGKLNLFTTLNAVLSVWLCFYLITTAVKYTKEKNSHIAIALIAVLLFSLAIWPITRGNAATTNYDFIKTLLVFVLFTETFVKKDITNNFSLNEEWLIWPVYLFTVRIINYPLLLLSLFAFYILAKNRKWRSCLLSIVYCLILIIPFLARNIITSGYPFYPAPYFNLFNVDWKADSQIIDKLLEYIKYYNRVSTSFLDIEQTKALGSGWIPAWFHYLFLYDKLILIPGIIGLITGLVVFVKNRSVLSAPYRFFLFTIIVSLISWFYISPDPRFVYGILLSGVFMLVYYCLKIISGEFLQKVISGIFILVLFSSGFYTVRKIIKQPSTVIWMKPAPLPKPPVTEISLDGIILRIPEKINNNWNPRCYGTTLPCLYQIDPRLKARGKDINSGFRLEK